MEALRELLHKQPFSPFVIRTSSGQSYEVRHPELAILLKTQVVIGFPEADRFAILPYLHVSSIESAAPASQSAP